MGDKALRSIPWTLLTYAVNKGLLLVTTIVLARILDPRDFGLIALATLALLTLAIFSDFGFGAAIVLRQDLGREGLRTALTAMLGLGLVVGGVIVALSPLAGRLFREPSLPPILTALAATVPIGAFVSFYESVLQRELEFRRRFAGQLVQGIAYTVVGLGAAVLGAGVWSLVAAQIASVTMQGATLLVLATIRVRPGFSGPAARDLLQTGRGFIAQGWLAFASQNADYFIVGRLLGTAPLAFYSMAYRVGSLPYLAIADPIAKVTFPAFAKLHQRGEDVTEAFLSTLRLIALATVPVGVILSAAAAPFTECVFGANWRPMIGVLTALGIWAAIRPTQVTVGWLLNSMGLAGSTAVVAAALLPVSIAALSLAAHRGGINAVAWVAVIMLVLSLTMLSLLVARRARIGVGRQLAALLPALAGSVPAWAAAKLAGDALMPAHPILALVAAVGAGAAAYAVTVIAVAPRLPAQTLRQVRRMVRPSAPILPGV